MTIKSWTLIAGIGLCGLGVICLPLGFGISPKRDLSLFDAFADTGAFALTGLGLISLGLIAIVFARLLK